MYAILSRFLTLDAEQPQSRQPLDRAAGQPARNEEILHNQPAGMEHTDPDTSDSQSLDREPSDCEQGIMENGPELAQALPG